MTQTVYVHVGMPKCASTTIQRQLAALRPQLARAGLAYPLFDAARDPHQGNGLAFEQAGLRGDPEEIDALVAQVSDRDGDILLSCETLSGLFQSRSMTLIASKFNDHGRDVKVIVIMRRHDLWLESDYKQHIVSDMAWAEPVEALVQKRQDQGVLGYPLMLESWVLHVPRHNVIAERLEALDPDYPVAFILNACGRDPADFDLGNLPTRANESPPTGLIEPARLLKRELMQSGMPSTEIKAEVSRFLATAPGVLAVPKRRFVMSTARRREIVETYRKQNWDLRRVFASGQGFDRAVEEDSASDADIQEEARAVLAAWSAAGMR